MVLFLQFPFEYPIQRTLHILYNDVGLDPLASLAVFSIDPCLDQNRLPSVVDRATNIWRSMSPTHMKEKGRSRLTDIWIVTYGYGEGWLRQCMKQMVQMRERETPP